MSMKARLVRCRLPSHLGPGSLRAITPRMRRNRPQSHPARAVVRPNYQALPAALGGRRNSKDLSIWLPSRIPSSFIALTLPCAVAAGCQTTPQWVVPELPVPVVAADPCGSGPWVRHGLLPLVWRDSRSRYSPATGNRPIPKDRITGWFVFPGAGSLAGAGSCTATLHCAFGPFT